MSTPPAVSITGLTKRYGRRAVVDDIDLTLPAAAVTGLVGPNGAGKTTIMAMLLGLVRPSAGEGTVLGDDLRHPERYLPRVGALIETPAAFPGLSARDNLRQLAVLGGHDASRIPGLLDLVGLGGRATDRVGTFSLGMKQRLGIAAALVPDPALVVLDEPANGLDPVGMRDLRRLITEMAAEGRAVLVSSHLLGELEQVCDHLVVLDEGDIAHSGSPDGLPRSQDEAVVVSPADTALLPQLDVLVESLAPQATREGDRITIRTEGHDPRALSAEINRAASAQGITLAEVSLRHTDLESRYLDLVGAR